MAKTIELFKIPTDYMEMPDNPESEGNQEKSAERSAEKQMMIAQDVGLGLKLDELQKARQARKNQRQFEKELQVA